MIKAICSSALLFNDTRPKIVFKENRAEYHGKNIDLKLVEGYQIDGKLIVSGCRCDKGLVVVSENIIFLIELKGCDLRHACDQISETVDFLKDKGINATFNARIVLSKVAAPDVESIQFKKLSKKMRILGGDLKKGSIRFKEVI